MSTKIQIKRGLSTKLPAVTLTAGEPVFVADLGKLYIGDGTTKILISPIDKSAGLNTTKSFTNYLVNAAKTGAVSSVSDCS